MSWWIGVIIAVLAVFFFAIHSHDLEHPEAVTVDLAPIEARLDSLEARPVIADTIAVIIEPHSHPHEHDHRPWCDQMNFECREE